MEVGAETVVLFGPSGCGKTTVLKAILGVHDPSMRVTGDILLDGKPIEPGTGTVGMVFQGPVVPTWMTVSNLCRMGSRIRSVPSEDQNERVLQILRRFEIDHLSERYPYQLSGGQKQRVALAVTLINEPSVLLLDEPTTFIDGVTRLAIWDFLAKQIRPLNIPTIIVSHDPAEAIILGDRIFVLERQSHLSICLDVPVPHPRSESVLSTSYYRDFKAAIESEYTFPCHRT